MVGDANRCLDREFTRHPTFPKITPNGAGIEMMLSGLAHELTETVSNIGGGWFSADGYENGDLCAWDFGKRILVDSKTGASYNLEFATGERYFIQQNWSPLTQSCVMTVS